jgi:hypothetical protein
MNKRYLISFAAALIGSFALAQNAIPPTKIRGTVDALDGQTLHVTTRTGDKVTVGLAPNFRVTGLIVAPLADIKPGSFIGTTAVPRPDGTLKALEVHVFPENMRGLGEGHYPWDVGGPSSTMTNGTIGTVEGSKDRTIIVKYKSGEKKVEVPDDVPIVTFEPGDVGLLKQGASIVVFANKGPDGALTASGVTVGKNGVTPPM